MSAVAEVESTELVTLPARELALQVYSTPGGLDPLIDEIRGKISGVVYDMSTRKGRDECASDAYKVARSKAAIEKLGKEISAEQKEVPKRIDAERRRAFTVLEMLQEEVRRPLTEWEEAEAARVVEHKAVIARLTAVASMSMDATAKEIADAITQVEAWTIDEGLEEFEAEAHRAKAKTLESLRADLARQQKSEADQAELVRLKAESEARRIQDEKDRIAREAAEAATRAAETKAQEERDAAARREAEARAATERAEQERMQAIERQRQAEERAEAERLASIERAKQAAEAARLAEVKRQAGEAARVTAEQKAREADRTHKAKVNNDVMTALIAGGLTAEAAKLAVVLIASHKVPAVRIEY